MIAPARPVAIIEMIMEWQPDKNQLIVVSFVTLAQKAETIAGLVLYDDPKTKRPVNYLEPYDSGGALLLIGWVDKFGIRRTAIDLGLCQADASELKEVLVLLTGGTPL